MSDNLRDRQQFETQKFKYIGVGSADTTRNEFISNVKRDTYSNLASHNPTLEYLSVSLNKPKKEIRFQMIEKMIRPLDNGIKTEKDKET
ncbi:hypothetical protein CANARDRAFT_26594 [[Candida] arabinofermentans NRRL YB-2248]|uniref:Splicing factor subunit n=1 Tax=[Candida] arabinofermentans NRRL YB-2248 TaxID=983967 RepID=A0A1E4T5Y2_9ASCO|nr:hypothetical protein CANARDRAFT_26594 [[Candida] arabinofermentans NRRL YB-2248]